MIDAKPLFYRAACVLAVGCALAVHPAAAAWSPPAFDPNHIEKYGYRLVYDVEFNDESAIDFNMAPDGNTGAGLYARLPDKWGGIRYSVTPDKAVIADGVLTIAGGQLSSFAQARNADGYVGTTFQGGGYFEARLKWDRQAVHADFKQKIGPDNWWPSFYSVPTEYFDGKMAIGGGPQNHFVENDWFEAWTGDNYAATMHDWFGPKGCYPGARNHGLGHCEIASDGQVQLPSGIEPTDPTPYGQTHLGSRIRLPADPENGFHTIGALWVSAEFSRDHIGYATFYFDGERVGEAKHWVSSPKEVIPPPLQSVFSELDHDHNVIFIGAPKNTPLQVDWIHVWQLASVPLSNPAIKPEPGFTGPNGRGN